ncbi:hypothetical protein F5Y16DRAFT_234639 [Xylariaceae sp. FL0255]|nr:hypothetical protein F5Y16DRAFT_234639 [Xylariaceae sp. FL0255]
MENRSDKRRIKQRERRQKWRKEKQSDIGCINQPLDLGIASLSVSPTTFDLMKHHPVHVNERRHRRSPMERSVILFAQLFQRDTRPADWELVCVEPGEFFAFPHRQPVLPLSRLSALIWATEYEIANTDIASFDRTALKKALVSLERDLAFHGKHLANAQGIARELDKLPRNDIQLQQQAELDFYLKYLKGRLNQEDDTIFLMKVRNMDLRNLSFWASQRIPKR